MQIRGWQQWLVLIAFVFALCLTGFFAVRTVEKARYWHSHTDEPIRGWMTIRHVAHSYHVPPHVLYKALGISHKLPDKRPLRDIANMQHRSMEQIRELLMDAIVHARPPYPPPPPPDEDNPAPAGKPAP